MSNQADEAAIKQHQISLMWAQYHDKTWRFDDDLVVNAAGELRIDQETGLALNGEWDCDDGDRNDVIAYNTWLPTFKTVKRKRPVVYYPRSKYAVNPN